MITSINKIILFSFTFLYPLFFLTITPDSYEYNKMVLLIITAVIFLTLSFITAIYEKKIVWFSSIYTLPLFLITAITVLSTLIQSPNLYVSLVTPLSTSTLIACFLLYVLTIQFLHESGKKIVLSILIADACLICLYIMLIYTGLVPKSVFTPAGSLLNTAIFLSLVSVFLIAKVLLTVLTRNYSGKNHNSLLLYYFFSLVLIIPTTIFLTVHLFLDQTPLILPLQFGWGVLLEVLKNFKSLLLGVGPTNFMTAFTLAKPIAFNSSPFWNVIFTSSSSYFLNLATEAGVIAAVLYLLILIKTVKVLLKDYSFSSQSPHPHLIDQVPYLLTLSFALIIQIILPTGMVVVITTYLLLALSSKKREVLNADLSPMGKGSYVLLIPVVILAPLILYFGAKWYLAEVKFKNSLDALLNNQGSEAYTFQKEAILLNPRIDRYHMAFSQTNLALANALASETTITDEDKQKIPVLIQQAIDQARLAVFLYRTNVINWDNLAKTYAALISFAKGAEEWTIQSYQQRLLLDPINPSSQIALGKVYMQLKRYTDAEGHFQQAVRLKPDYANAHYQLAQSLAAADKHIEAFKELQTALAYLPQESPDASLVQKELDDLKLLIPPLEATSSPQLIPPETTNQTIEIPSSEENPIEKLPTLIPALSF